MQVSDLEKLKFEIEDTNISIEKVLAGTLDKFGNEIKESSEKLTRAKKQALEKEKQLSEVDKSIAQFKITLTENHNPK